MLRRIFYGNHHEPQAELDLNRWFDAKPREILITACLLLPIVGIGFYPKLATQTYDVKTTEVAAVVRNALPVFAQQRQQNRLFSGGLFAPDITSPQTLLGVTDLGKGA